MNGDILTVHRSICIYNKLLIQDCVFVSVTSVEKVILCSKAIKIKNVWCLLSEPLKDRISGTEACQNFPTVLASSDKEIIVPTLSVFLNLKNQNNSPSCGVVVLKKRVAIFQFH